VVPSFLISLDITQDFREFLNRVPTARGDRHTQALLYLAQLADRLHPPTIQTQFQSRRLVNLLPAVRA